MWHAASKPGERESVVPVCEANVQASDEGCMKTLGALQFATRKQVGSTRKRASMLARVRSIAAFRPLAKQRTRRSPRAGPTHRSV